jgi:hypothetical protein
MSNILDRIGAATRMGFRPGTHGEFFALRLAQKLGDAASARHYLSLIEQHTLSRVLCIYRRTMARSSGGRDLARRFHVELQNSNGNGNGQDNHMVSLAALKVERRSVAVAVFIGNQVEYHEVRQLSSVREKAEASAIGFLNWIAGNFEIESAALESMPARSDIQRAVLSRLVKEALWKSGVPVWEISKAELLAAYGHPGAKSRKELRKAVCSIWPVLEGDPGVCDAAALGLYVQTERLFSLDPFSDS